MKHTPLIIGLAGDNLSGRDEVAKFLKRVHNFSVYAFEQPLFDAIQALYGITALDLLTAKDRPFERAANRTPRALVEALGTHVRTTAHAQVLAARLISRAMVRGDWNSAEIVITDVRHPADLTWLRLVGGRVWWITRPNTPDCGTRDLMLAQYAAVDTVIRNDSTLEELDTRVKNALEYARRDNALPTPQETTHGN
jgi:hypothetical protein